MFFGDLSNISINFTFLNGKTNEKKLMKKRSSHPKLSIVPIVFETPIRLD